MWGGAPHLLSRKVDLTPPRPSGIGTLLLSRSRQQTADILQGDTLKTRETPKKFRKEMNVET